MRNKAFEQAVKKYLKGELSAEEKLEIDSWLDQLSENTNADLPEQEFTATKNRIFNELNGRINQKKVVKTAWVIRLKPLLKVAACFILTASLVFVFRVKLKEVFDIGQVKTVSNVNGHITKSILADGTIIWLKGNSKLRFPIRFKDSLRVVYLQGEALFEVAKDRAHPFIIHSGALVTRVLGTSFNIKQNHSETEVAVLTGRVYLSAQNVASVVLKPYQQALFSPHEKTLLKTARPKLQVLALTSGTEYEMLFNDAPLAEVLKRVEKKFNVSLTLQKTELGKTLVTADLTDQSLNNTLNMICTALSLDYKFENETILITKTNRSL